MSKGQINVEIRHKALFQKLFHRVHFRSEQGFAVLRSPAPEAALFHYSSKGRMTPLLLMDSRYHILMGHEKDRFLLRIIRFPVEEKAGLANPCKTQLFKIKGQASCMY